MATIHSRILIKRSTTPGELPTVPVSNDHTDGTWVPTDIYEGEIFINIPDDKVYTRVDSGIVLIAKFSDITAANVGNTTAQWNANQIRGMLVSTTGPSGSNLYLKYNTVSGEIEWNSVPSTSFASQSEADAGTVNNKAVAPDTLNNLEALEFALVNSYMAITRI